MKELGQYLEIAKTAAQIGAANLAEARGSSLVTSENGHDIKLDVDTSTEAKILEYLKRESPFAILSEELGHVEGCDGDLTWLVDPLDGSFNFVKQVPFFCVSIALWNGNEPVLGVIHDFSRNEVFSGVVGQGAWVNGIALKVSSVADVRHAVLATGFPSHSDYETDAVRDFIVRVQAFQKIRMMGSAALSLAYVGAGRLDAYFEENINLWDVGAGLAIVRASGGSVETRAGKSKYQRVVYAGNGLLPSCLSEG